jgi:hypothetical protein
MTVDQGARVLAACSMAFAAAVVLARQSGEPPKDAAGSDVAPAGPSNKAVQTAKPVSDERLLEIARTYSTWERVTDQAHFAPARCWTPGPAGVQSSDSLDEATHGRKLYFLYAAKPKDYLSLNWSTEAAFAPIGQVLVKETFKPEPVALKDVPADGASETHGRMHPPEYLIRGEEAFKTGAKRELFIMTKVDPAAPGTDQGWVYATVTADRTRVIESGAIASCMGCHTKQRHDRQFGLELARTLTATLAEKTPEMNKGAAGTSSPEK